MRMGDSRARIVVEGSGWFITALGIIGILWGVALFALPKSAQEVDAVGRLLAGLAAALWAASSRGKEVTALVRSEPPGKRKAMPSIPLSGAIGSVLAGVLTWRHVGLSRALVGAGISLATFALFDKSRATEMLILTIVVALAAASRCLDLLPWSIALFVVGLTCVSSGLSLERRWQRRKPFLGTAPKVGENRGQPRGA
jgi:hypothetical protein